MRNDVLTLINQTYVTDDYGVERATETPKNVFCDVASITQNEFYAANEAGLKPALRFDIFAYDYSGEELVEFNGVRYTIYRTYQRYNDVLELYTQKEVGVNG